MNVIYIFHAEEKLAERRIPKRLVEKTFKEPDVVLRGNFGRKIAHKLIKDKLLRIVYTTEKDTYIVITAYYTHPERYEAKE